MEFLTSLVLEAGVALTESAAVAAAVPSAGRILS
jgi:hypothetical protein